MEKITLNVYGTTVMVDSDQVDYHLSKDAAVRTVLQIQKDPNPSIGQNALKEKMLRRIIRLNRKIRRNVQVVGRV